MDITCPPRRRHHQSRGADQWNSIKQSITSQSSMWHGEPLPSSRMWGVGVGWSSSPPNEASSHPEMLDRQQGSSYCRGQTQSDIQEERAESVVGGTSALGSRLPRSSVGWGRGEKKRQFTLSKVLKRLYMRTLGVNVHQAPTSYRQRNGLGVFGTLTVSGAFWRAATRHQRQDDTHRHIQGSKYYGTVPNLRHYYGTAPNLRHLIKKKIIKITYTN